MINILLMLAKKEHVSELASILSSEKHKVIIGEKGISVRGYIHDNPDIVILDSSYGAAMIDEVRKNLPNKPCICLLPEYDARMAVELLKAGAFDCINPPLRRSAVNVVINHAIRSYGLFKADASVKIKRFKKYLNKRNIIIACAGLLLAVYAGVILGQKQFIRIDLPYNDPTSVLSDGGNMWLSNWYTQSIYKYQEKDNKLDLKKAYFFSDFGPLVIAKYENYIWSVGNDLVLRQHVINENLDIIRNYKLREGSPSGMAFVGNNLWMCDSVTKKIYQYYVGSELLLINSYNSGLTAPIGLYWDGKYVWIADASTNKAYVFAQKMDNLELARVYRLPKHSAGALSGMCIRGDKIYLIYNGSPSCVIIVKIGKLKLEI
ncbi:MAG: hypothetical protein ABII64_06335 [Elusimicrobiota bacterium]